MTAAVSLKGKVAFVAGVADSNGYGWAIARALADAGATIVVGTWPPVRNIFKTALDRGSFDDDSTLSDGSKMKIEKIYPLDAVFDTPADVPDDFKNNKRYSGLDGYTISEVAEAIKADYGKIDIVVHSLANGPEVKKPLLETSRQGYLAASSASAYSAVSLLQHLAPIMNEGGSFLSLTYIASEKAIPGYGGGMSSAKAQLESDTRTLAFEAGRKYKIRVNTISAGPLKSRAAGAIGAGEKGPDPSSKKLSIIPKLTPHWHKIYTMMMLVTLVFSYRVQWPDALPVSHFTSTMVYTVWEWLLTVKPWLVLKFTFWPREKKKPQTKLNQKIIYMTSISLIRYFLNT